MSTLIKTFARFFGSRSELNIIETQILEAVALALSPNAASLLRHQVSLINKAQRPDRNREVDFYHVEQGNPKFPEAALFPNRAEEFEFARLRITDVPTGHQTVATVWMVKGRVFSIEFSHTPKDLTDDVKIEIEQLADPMCIASNQSGGTMDMK